LSISGHSLAMKIMPRGIENNFVHTSMGEEAIITVQRSRML
jgi:hypothetical protein